MAKNSKELRFLRSNHISTKRNYLERMNDNKIVCMIEAKKYGKNYWDGKRKYGYGGYKYNGSWIDVAKKIIRRYKLNKNSKIIDIGCGKGEFVELLNEEIKYYSLRALSKPGITGWAQVNYPYGASINDSKNKLSYDLYYLKHYSLLFDLLIFFKTIRLVINARGSEPSN